LRMQWPFIYWRSMKTSEMWSNARHIEQQLLKSSKFELLSAVKGSSGIKVIAQVLSRAEMTDLGDTESRTNEELLALPGLTGPDVTVIRAAWFYLSGHGTKGQVAWHRARITDRIAEIKKAREVLARRVRTLDKSSAALQQRLDSLVEVDFTRSR